VIDPATSSLARRAVEVAKLGSETALTIAEDVITRSLEKVAQETTVRKELEAGESLATVFARHRIL